MIKLLSFGAGVNSVALLGLAVQGELEFDYCIYAETGGEYPETDRWVEEFAKPICKELGVPFIEVKGGYNGFEDLYEHSIAHKIFPFRTNRFCTTDFKRKPIEKWVKENIEDEYITIIGFAWDERKRAVRMGTELYEYPLIDKHITRAGCKRIIRSLGWKMPVKSGCWFCPFQSKKEYKKLFDTHPNLYAKAQTLEENSSLYPKNTIMGDISLKELKTRRGLNDGKTQQNLEGECAFCCL